MSRTYLTNKERVIDYPQDGKTAALAWADFVGPQRGVRQIVLGKLEDKPVVEEDKKTVIEPLPADFTVRFPDLTHLYLWNCKGLGTTLPRLPAGLKCLDLRGCAEIDELPTLPNTLETLDVADCTGLMSLPRGGLANLRWFHVDRAQALEAFSISYVLDGATSLEEFTASGCAQLKVLNLPKQEREAPVAEHGAIRFPGKRLKKLVLAECTGLTVLPDLAPYRWLHHLNLNGCSALLVMPPLHVRFDRTTQERMGIRTLYSSRCLQLKEYKSLDIRAVHRSDDRNDDHNVAGTFRTLTRLGGQPAELVMSKALFLGSGRCGKTTIAKALVWASLNKEERELEQNIKRYAPDPDESSTHNIRFDLWRTRFVEPGKSVSDGKTGSLHMWDFGGQEIYHNTHRIFASQGSVFVIATTSEDEHEARLKKEDDEDADSKENKRVNEYRELKYWFDYIRHALEIATVAEFEEKLQRGKVLVRVVFTGSDAAAWTEDKVEQTLTAQAGPYGHLLNKHGGITIDRINFVPERNTPPVGGFTSLQSWIGHAAGRASDQLGVRIPKPYVDIAQRCESLLQDRRDPKFDFDWEEWSQLVAGELPDTSRQGELDESVEAITDYLHRCGRVFRLKGKVDSQRVIYKQEGMIEKIYALTREVRMCGKSFHSPLASLTRRFFTSDEFRDVIVDHGSFNLRNQTIDADDWRFFLALLDQCDVCVKAGDGDKWMAIQHELLPTRDKSMEEDLTKGWFSVCRDADLPWRNHSYLLQGGKKGGLLGHSDYRAVLAFFVRHLNGEVPRQLFGDVEKNGAKSEVDWNHRISYSEDCLFWNNGFLVQLSRKTEEDAAEDVALAIQIEWLPAASADQPEVHKFEGGLRVQLLSADPDTFGPRLATLLRGKDAPLELFRQEIEDLLEEGDELPKDTPLELLHQPRGTATIPWTVNLGNNSRTVRGRYAIALSYRGEQKELAKKIEGALRQQAWQVVHYYEKRPDTDDPRNMVAMYDALKNARVLIVIAAQDYFTSPIAPDSIDKKPKKTDNRYCPVELAEAVLALKENGGHRDASQLLWVIGQSGVAGFVRHKDLDTKVPQLLEEYVTQIHEGELASGWLKLSKLQQREVGAVINALKDENKETFRELVCGNLGKSVLRVAGENSECDAKRLVDRVRAALEL